MVISRVARPVKRGKEAYRPGTWYLSPGLCRSSIWLNRSSAFDTRTDVRSGSLTSMARCRRFKSDVIPSSSPRAASLSSGSTPRRHASPSSASSVAAAADEAMLCQGLRCGILSAYWTASNSRCNEATWSLNDGMLRRRAACGRASVGRERVSESARDCH